jgi:hypothetical protein
MATYSAGQIINGALRLIGQLAEGETPSAATSQDALMAMNQMIDSWNTERLSVFCTQDQVFSWPVNQRTVTVGPTGDFVGNRPVLVDSSTYFVQNQISYTLYQVNEDQYNAIALKSNTSTIPQVLFVNYTMPDATMKIYPVPTTTIELHLISIQELDQPALLSTQLIFPPGYMRAFRFNVAVEIANEFGIEAPPSVKRIADKSKRDLKVINNPDDILQIPSALVSRRNCNYNIFSNLPM